MRILQVDAGRFVMCADVGYRGFDPFEDTASLKYNPPVLQSWIVTGVRSV